MLSDIQISELVEGVFIVSNPHNILKADRQSILCIIMWTETAADLLSDS